MHDILQCVSLEGAFIPDYAFVCIIWNLDVWLFINVQHKIYIITYLQLCRRWWRQESGIQLVVNPRIKLIHFGISRTDKSNFQLCLPRKPIVQRSDQNGFCCDRTATITLSKTIFDKVTTPVRFPATGLKRNRQLAILACITVTSHYLIQWWRILPTHWCVTRPQWVETCWIWKKIECIVVTNKSMDYIR